ncbi:hypothetical protein HDV05_005557 [Chytridiales sp. JEL 0842]|nr:hypothetical protein HDV05_005557 [Chytridiales sp. JEL 0842]
MTLGNPWCTMVNLEQEGDEEDDEEDDQQSTLTNDRRRTYTTSNESARQQLYHSKKSVVITCREGRTRLPLINPPPASLPSSFSSGTNYSTLMHADLATLLRAADLYAPRIVSNTMGRLSTGSGCSSLMIKRPTSNGSLNESATLTSAGLAPIVEGTSTAMSEDVRQQPDKLRHSHALVDTPTSPQRRSSNSAPSPYSSFRKTLSAQSIAQTEANSQTTFKTLSRESLRSSSTKDEDDATLFEHVWNTSNTSPTSTLSRRNSPPALIGGVNGGGTFLPPLKLTQVEDPRVFVKRGGVSTVSTSLKRESNLSAMPYDPTPTPTPTSKPQESNEDSEQEKEEEEDDNDDTHSIIHSEITDLTDLHLKHPTPTYPKLPFPAPPSLSTNRSMSMDPTLPSSSTLLRSQMINSWSSHLPTPTPHRTSFQVSVSSPPRKRKPTPSSSSSSSSSRMSNAQMLGTVPVPYAPPPPLPPTTTTTTATTAPIAAVTGGGVQMGKSWSYSSGLGKRESGGVYQYAQTNGGRKEEVKRDSQEMRGGEEGVGGGLKKSWKRWGEGIVRRFVL